MSFVDDCNSIRIGSKKEMDECFNEAAEEWGLSWDKGKVWKDAVHLGANIDRRKHQKYRTSRARAMWEMVKRLTRLHPKEKAQIVVGQILPTLLYEAELHDTPWEEGQRLLREMRRWITGAYRGSSSERLQKITGIEGLEKQMLVKKVRWAASVYGRSIPILRKKEEEILKEHTKGQRRWMSGEDGRITNVTIGEDAAGAIYSDSSRRGGHTAAATTKDTWYLGEMATVMDAEVLGIAMGWAKAKRVATDSHGAIGRIEALRDSKPKSWIEELVVRVQKTEEKEVVWVKAHSGVPRNEYADFKAKEAAYIGSSMHQRQTCTAAGIRQEFRSNRLTKQVKTWNRNALKALVYLETDKGPLKHWLHKIGRAEDNECPCHKAAQNSAHILRCEEIGDGKGRKREEAEEDEEWCEAVYEMLQRNVK